jgi:predicted secreted Zn-dependent protease
MSVEFSDTERGFYDVDADSLAAAAEAISQMAEAAETEWFPRYEYQTMGHALSSAAVSVRTRITLPRWTGYRSAAKAEQDEWRRFCAALEAHEEGHIELVVRHFSDLDERLVGQSVAAAQRVWERALAALESASQAYDRETDHGRKRGTIIDVSAGVL